MRSTFIRILKLSGINSGIKNQLQFLLHFFILVFLLGLLVYSLGFFFYDSQISSLADLQSFLEISSLFSVALVAMGVLYTIPLILRRERFLAKSFLRQSLFAIALIVILYFYGQQDRFLAGANPIEDLVDFCFILCLVLSLWILTSFIFKWFNEKYSTLPKSVFLLARGIVLLVLLIPLDLLLNYLFLDLVYDLPLYEDYWVLEVPFKILIVLLVNFLDEVIRIKQDSLSKPLQIKAKAGSQNRFFELSQIAYFLVKNQITYLYTVSGEKFITDLTLLQLEKQLKDHDFFRANRQLLIARKAVEGYRSAEGKKIELSLSVAEDSTSTYYISRLGAPSFRKWISHELGTIQP